MFIRSAVALFVVVLTTTLVSATHLRSGYIRAERLGNGLKCKITLRIFTNTKNTTVKMGGDPDLSYLYFGDGERVYVPEIDDDLRLDLDMNGYVAEGVFTVEHTYAKEGNYVMSYSEPYRNAGVVNMDNSVSTLFYIETEIVLKPVFVASPAPMLEPVFMRQLGGVFSAAVTAGDGLDRRYHYMLTTPMQATGSPVTNYVLPTGVSINPVTGVLTWPDQSPLGEYAFAAKVTQYSHDGAYLGYVDIDFQVMVKDGPAQPPLADNLDLDEYNRIYLAPGSTRVIRIFAENEQVDQVSFRDSTVLNSETQFPGAYALKEYDSTQGSRKIHVGVITLTGLPQIVRNSPYPIVVRTTYRYADFETRDLVYTVYTREAPDPTVATEPVAETLRPYPNPVSDRLHMDWTGVRSILIYSSDGRLIYASATPTESIDLSNYGPGVYMLCCERLDHSHKFEKIIKY